jgi:hypothetical protein
MKPLLAATLIAAALPAQAQVYKWVDANGQANYSNAPPASAAGAQRVEERISILGIDPYVRADAERRWAARAAQEERDWQLRQQALAMQYSQQQPSSYMDYGYDYPYYGAGYYGAAYGAGYYRPAVRHYVRHHSHAPRVTPYARASTGSRGGRR